MPNIGLKFSGLMQTAMKQIIVKKAIFCQWLLQFKAIVLFVWDRQLGQISIHILNEQGRYSYQIWPLETMAGLPAKSSNYEQRVFIMVSSNNGALLPTHNNAISMEAATQGGSIMREELTQCDSRRGDIGAA